MCLIIVKKKGVDLPSRDLLEESFLGNSDGSGFVYVRNGINHLRKGFFNMDKWIDAIYKEVKKDDLLITHSRIMTSGVKDIYNTQPFIIDREYEEIVKSYVDTRRPVVAHNGIISDYGGKQYSDTIDFIREVLSDKVVLQNLKQPVIRILIERAINNSRLALVQNGELYLFGEWVEEDGLLLSHARYSFHSWRTFDDYPKKFTSSSELIGTCEWCGKKNTKLFYVDGDYVCKDCYDYFKDALEEDWSDYKKFHKEGDR